MEKNEFNELLDSIVECADKVAKLVVEYAPIPLNCRQAAEPRCRFLEIINFSSLNLHHKDE